MPKLPFQYIDYGSQFVITMTPEHHARELGEAFVFDVQFGAVNTNASVYIEYIIPASTTITQFAFKPSFITSDQLIKSEFYEAPTVTDGTTSANIKNQDRTSTVTPVTHIYTDPTAISGGTLIRTRYGGTGTNAKPVGFGSDSTDLGWSLKKNTKYVLKLTNIGGQATTFVAINGQFYEILNR